MHRAAPTALAIATALAAVAGCDDQLVPSGPPPAKPSLGAILTLVSAPTLLSPVPGSAWAWAYAVNNGGSVAGSSADPKLPADASEVAVVWPNGAVTPTVVDPVNSEARAINDAGQLAGWRSPDGLTSKAALWTPDGNGTYIFTDIGAQITANFGSTYSAARGINAYGQVVGDYIGGCFLWTPTAPNAPTTGSVTRVGHLNGNGDLIDVPCEAYAINSDGKVAGRYWNAQEGGSFPGTMHGFVWVPTSYNGSLGVFWDVAPGSRSWAMAINDADQAAGVYGPEPTDAAIFNPAGSISWTVLDLGHPTLPSIGSSSSAQLVDINNAGYAVGLASSQKGDQGFVWRNGSFYELPNSPLLPYTYVTGMNDGVNDVVSVVGAARYNNTAVASPLVWTVTVASVEVQIEVLYLEGLVHDYNTRGVLNVGEARSLLAKIDGAARQTAQQQQVAAINLIGAFANEVNGLVAARRLTADLAQPLLDHARLAIAALQAPRG